MTARSRSTASPARARCSLSVMMASYSASLTFAVLHPRTPTLIMARILLIDDDDSVRTMLRLTLDHLATP